MTNPSRTDRKASADIYRNAARRLEEGEHAGCSGGEGCRFSCCYIRGLSDGNDQVLRYESVFMPSIWDQQQGWWNDEDFRDENTNARIIALCLMAAMVEAGDA